MSEVFEDIIKWAKERGIFEKSNSHVQMTKLTEENGEIAKALFSGDRENLATEIGDAGVVLTILAGMNGLSFEQCMVKANKKNNSRKTKMVKGVAVKEEDYNSPGYDK